MGATGAASEFERRLAWVARRARRAGSLVGLALLACIGSSALLVAPAEAETFFPEPTTITETFAYTGAEQTLTVPTGVFSVQVLAIGGHGGSAGAAGGAGAQVSGEVSVTPGQTLYIEVGGNGTASAGGWNGGGSATGEAAGGGGASDVRTSTLTAGLLPDDRLIVAGGGGGGGTLGHVGAGAGGAAGQAGEAVEIDGGGEAGTQSGGGAGAVGGCETGGTGTLGAGGNGGSRVYPGGGGGGGYYGGGGGGGGCYSGGGGGGGGSSLTPAGGSLTLASPSAEPQVQITYAKPPNPTVATAAASQVTQTSAILHATVDPEGFEVSDCRFEYGTSSAYGSSVPCETPPGSGTSPVEVSATASGLSANTTYHFRIVATNVEGTSYGLDETFSTPFNRPAVVTEAASAVTRTSATLNATVNPEGTEVTDCHFEYGTSPSYGSSAPCSSSPGSGNSPVTVSAPASALSGGTTYHFRVVATNRSGTSHSSDGTFSTLATTQTFAYTGAEQTFTVPAGVFVVQVLAIGGHGGSAGASGGAGAQVSGDLSVTPGETLYVEVGGNGATGSGGWNGGGKASGSAGGGGGASDVRTSPFTIGLSPDDRIIVAGGGGGSGVRGQVGAGAGGAAGQPGGFIEVDNGGSGGTQSGGGAGGTAGCETGQAGQLGAGGAGASYIDAGGGGGGGYYGGGGGGAGCSSGGGGGGGGSSLTPESGTAGLATPSAEPQVQISYTKPPAVTTEATSGISQTSATLHASVDPEGAEVSDCHFEYGTSSSYGSSVPCETSPGSGTSAVEVSATANGLSANTIYHFRIVATSSGGTSVGSDETFTTLPNAPTVLTGGASAITNVSATLGGSVNPNGGSVGACEVEYGTTEAYGSSVPCTPSPGSGEEAVSIAGPIGGLEPKTTYHYRVLASNAGGEGEGQDETFTTLPNAPVVTQVKPDAGLQAGGTPVTITGSNLAGAAAVAFGNSSVSASCTETECTATSPAGTSTVNVTVTTTGGTSATSAADEFIYVPPGPAPTIKKLSPKKGPAAGGTTVTITGAGLLGTTEVQFGSTAASDVKVLSATSITAVSPAGTTGAVNVTVTTPNGTSATSAKDQFTYEHPTIAHVSPNAGSMSGGTTVTVTGSGFAPGKASTQLAFGKTPGTSVECASSTTCTVVSPAAKKTGAVDVRATVGGKISAEGTADQFTYSGG